MSTEDAVSDVLRIDSGFREYEAGNLFAENLYNRLRELGFTSEDTSSRPSNTTFYALLRKGTKYVEIISAVLFSPYTHVHVRQKQ